MSFLGEYFHLVVNRICGGYLTYMELHLMMISTAMSVKTSFPASVQLYSATCLQACESGQRVAKS